jgi:peptidyl-prolyl cis-trans isomerase SurA
MNQTRLLFVAITALFLSLSAPAPQALAEAQGVVAIVNDQPVTERDITEHMALLTILGDAPRSGLNRKTALRSLIDEQIKISEATKFKMMPTSKEVDDQVGRMAKGMGTGGDGLAAKLKKQGVSDTAFKRYVGALIGFNRVLSGKYRSKVTATDGEIDAKMAEIKGKVNGQISKIMNDPRMKGVTVYSLLEISLPVEGNDAMLMQARAVEAQQVLQRFKGCNNARSAAEGVFNVKVGKTFEADAAKLPKSLRSAIEKAGVGRAVGPMRGKGGIQLLALCGVRKLTPPKPDFKMPDRQQVERMVLNEKYDGLEEDYLSTARGSVYVEYRNPDYAQQ